MAKSKSRNGVPPAVCTQTILDEPALSHQVLQGRSRAGCIPSAGPSLLCWKFCKPPGLSGTLWGTLASAASTQEDNSSAKIKLQNIREGRRCRSTEVSMMGRV